MSTESKPRRWALFGFQMAVALAVSQGIRGLLRLYQTSQAPAPIEHRELLPPNWRQFATTPPTTTTATVGNTVMTYVAGAIVVVWLAVYLYAWSWSNFLLTRALQNYAAWQVLAALLISINTIASVWFWFGVLFQVCAILAILEYFGWLLILLKLLEGAVDALRPN